MIADEHCSQDPSLFASGGSLDYKCCTVEDIANGPHQFDLVVASEVLEHITQLDHFLFHLCTTIKVCMLGKSLSCILKFSCSLEALQYLLLSIGHICHMLLPS